MFLEIKDYQMIRVDDIVSFSIYPHEDSMSTTLYIKFRGCEGYTTYHFNTMRETRIAYNKIVRALKSLSVKMEKIKDYD